MLSTMVKYSEVTSLDEWDPETNHISGNVAKLRLRNFVFCIQSCNENFAEKFNLDDDIIQFFVAGFEIAPTTGRHHVQGYCELNKQMSFSTLKKMLPTAWIANAKGNAAQNTKYCTKDGIYVIQGSPKEPGARTDLKNILTAVKAGTCVREIIDDNPNMQALRFAENCVKYFEPKRNFRPKIVWIFGRSGAGKSRAAREICTEYLATRDPPVDPTWGIYEKNNFPLKWFDGYDGHPAIVIDDIRPEFTKEFNFTMFLAMLDRYAYTVESKGSTRQLRAEIMVITTTLSPVEFANRVLLEDPFQIYRRLDQIIRYEYAPRNNYLLSGATEQVRYSGAQRSRVILDLDLREHPDVVCEKVEDFCHPQHAAALSSELQPPVSTVDVSLSLDIDLDTNRSCIMTYEVEPVDVSLSLDINLDYNLEFTEEELLALELELNKL